MVKIVDFVRCDSKEDGSITCSFEDWNMDFTGSTWTDKKMAMECSGKTVQEIKEKREELMEVFRDWCTNYCIDPVE